MVRLVSAQHDGATNGKPSQRRFNLVCRPRHFVFFFVAWALVVYQTGQAMHRSLPNEAVSFQSTSKPNQGVRKGRFNGGADITPRLVRFRDRNGGNKLQEPHKLQQVERYISSLMTSKEAEQKLFFKNQQRGSLIQNIQEFRRRQQIAPEKMRSLQNRSAGVGLGRDRAQRQRLSKASKYSKPHFNPNGDKLKAFTMLYNNNNTREVRENDQELSLMKLDYLRKLESKQLFNFSQPAIPNNLTLPPPRKLASSASKMAVVVLSSRSHFQARQAIRETWGKSSAATVLFVVGGWDAPHNRTRLESPWNVTLRAFDDNETWTQIDGDNVVVATVMEILPNVSKIVQIQRRILEWVEEPADVPRRLYEEAVQHGDLLDVVHPDKYSSLPFKLRRGFQWIIENLPNVDWIVKTDDDMMVNLAPLQKVMLDTFNPKKPIVIGKIESTAKVQRWQDSWFEHLYPYTTYPSFPLGSYGYVVSAPVARYVAQEMHDSDVIYYQGEDTSLGIWLDRAAKEKNVTTQWLNLVDLFFNNAGGNCSEDTPPWIIHGHYLTPSQIRTCYKFIGMEWPQEWINRAAVRIAAKTGGETVSGLFRNRNPRVQEARIPKANLTRMLPNSLRQKYEKVEAAAFRLASANSPREKYEKIEAAAVRLASPNSR